MEQLLLQDNVMIIHNTYIGALYNRLVCRLSFPCCVPVAWCEKLYCAIHHNLWTVLKLVKKHSNNNVHMCIWPKCPSMLFESICRAFDNVHGKVRLCIYVPVNIALCIYFRYPLALCTVCAQYGST